MEYFPQELVDHVVDFLWEDDSTLAACSLVSTSWTRSAQLHLFRELTFRTGYDIIVLSDFAYSSPTLCSYVRTLYLTEHDPDNNVGLDPVLLTNILAGFPHLEHLHLVALPIFPPPYASGSGHSSLHKVLPQIKGSSLQSLFLEDVSLRGKYQLRTLHQLFQPFSYIHHLLIDNIRSEYDDEEIFPDFGTFIVGLLNTMDFQTNLQVESLTMKGHRNAGAVYFRVLKRVPTITLQSLQLELGLSTPDLVPLLGDMLRSIAPGVQDLTLHVGRDPDQNQYTIPLSPFTSLHTLRFIMHAGTYPDFFDTTLDMYPDWRPSTSLKVIYDFHGWNVKFPSRIQWPKEQLDWQKLQRLLLALPKTPTGLQLIFRSVRERDPWDYGSEEVIRRKLFKLETRGLLAFGGEGEREEHYCQMFMYTP